MLHSPSIEKQLAQAEHLKPLRPIGAVAALIHRRMRDRPAEPILYIAQTSRRARDIADVLRTLAGPEAAAEFPRWDGFPGDGLPASPQAMGTRMSTLRWLLNEEKRPGAVITTAAAVLRRVPPRAIWKDIHLEFRVGETIDLEETRLRLSRIGYRLDERVDEPGEAAIRGRVVEFFPAAAPLPCRIEHEDGRIGAIRSYDPVTQRSLAESEHLIVDPASEFVGDHQPADDGEPQIAKAYGTPETLFDYLPDAEIMLEDGVDRRARDVFAAIEEAQKEARAGLDLQADFLNPAEWSRLAAARLAAVVEDAHDDEDDAHVPAFARMEDPQEAFLGFIDPLRKKGYRIVLAGPDGQTMRLWSRRLARICGDNPRDVEEWREVLGAKKGQLLRFRAPISQGFVAHSDRIALISLRDLAGQSAGSGSMGRDAIFSHADDSFGIGDAVVHFDHGVGILEGLESVSNGEGETEALRLRYAEDAKLLVPMAEIGALWRYGGSGTDVSLDRLKGDAWAKKRDRIVAEIAGTAQKMVALLKEREAARTAPIRPDRLEFERFCARFAYELTPDQASATEAALADLTSGRPMDRLVCGDVGFGKTEVALRAAAAAVFAGKQVAVVAPTTVLVRQHLSVFQRRFARFGIEVEQLSRLAAPAEARAVKKGLADGSIRVVIATHAICAEDVAFKDLALVVIDEEQRFGARHKEAMRSLAPALHVLSMTATPIPRTLQAGFVGLHDLSVIATPPVRRRPIRTSTIPFADEPIREALESERKRGGQSFVVCPRIEDLEPMAARLRAIVPGLAVTMLHGEMPPAEVDEAMLAFSHGEGDVLLATNIVESGLDVPRANTMIVYRPDRFGLAQLHQLRGRVGRGTRRGVAILATEPDAPLGESAAERLRTLEKLNRLGAGFEISARDLDLRGAGELLGEEQAGHLQMIGLSLYRRTLERALVAARGETPPDDWRADLNLGLSGAIPADYLPEPELRIELAAQLDGIEDDVSLDIIKAEIADRFGPLPSILETGFKLAALRLRCRALGVRKLDAGPRAVAATFAKTEASALKKRIRPKKNEALRWSGLRLVMEVESEDEAERIAAAERLLERIA